MSEAVKRSWRSLRISLKTLLVLVALIAVYFGGRASMRPKWFPPPTGTWQLKMPSGYVKQVQIEPLPTGDFRLLAGTNSTLGGKYQWTSRKLVVVIPDDKRYTGLVWQWDGDDLILVAEPSGTPAGPSYLGARLHFLSPELTIEVPETISSTGEESSPNIATTDWQDPEPGKWELTMAAGFKRKVTIKKLPDGSFELVDGSSNLAGIYEVKNKQLEATQPRNPRYKGLTWARQKDELVLISEPSSEGTQYVGSRLRPLQPESTGN